MQLSTLALLSLGAVAFNASAQSSDLPTQPQPSFDFVQIGYVNYDVSNIIRDMDGLTLRSSYQLGTAFFAAFDYEDISGSGSFGSFRASGDSRQLFANVGYQFYQQRATSVYVAGGFARSEYKGGVRYPDRGWERFSLDGNGFNLMVGARHRFSEQFEIDMSLRHVDVTDDTDQIIDVNARYFFNPRFSIDARYTRIDSNMSGVGFGASFHF